MSAPLWIATALTTIAALADGDEARPAADNNRERELTIPATRGMNLDQQGRVIDLVGDYDQLSAADRDRLPCPELR